VTAPLWELLLGSVAIVVFFGAVGEGISWLIRRAGVRAGYRDATLVRIRDVTRVIWIFLAVVVIALYTDLAFYTDLFSELSILAVSTVGGLIVSLALQSTLTNVIAGLFMLQDGTLRVGDEVTYSAVVGTVVRITLRTSWIMTEKGTIAVVSNSNMMGGPLIIRSGTPRLVRRYHLEHVVPAVQPPAGPAAPPGGVAAVAEKNSDEREEKRARGRSRKGSVKTLEEGQR
jgi:small-conductance mechanosensitive channel